MTGLEFVDSVSEKRPARTDYSFTWKQKDVDLGDGSLRLEVEVDGDQVAGYREFVKVPEGWTRDYQKLRSRNEAATCGGRGPLDSVVHRRACPPDPAPAQTRRAHLSLAGFRAWSRRCSISSAR